MRCASCGTQNEPNSRFCGGCGARLSAGETRLAPTQKVTGGAAEVQARAQLVTPSSPVPVIATPAPGSLPPGTPLPGAGVGSLRPGTPIPGTLSGGPGGQQAARGPSGQQAVAHRAASAPFVAPAGPASAPVAAQRGAEPPRIANSIRGVPVPGAGPGGIPGTIGSPAPPRMMAPAAAAGPADRNRMGILIGVLVLDLALAVAGAWLLSEGLAAGSPASPSPQGPPPSQPAPRPAPPSPS